MEDALAALAQALLGPTAATRTTSEEVDDACYSNLHRGLQTLLEIVPRAAAQLVSALNKHYPFRTRGSDMQVYIYNYIYTCIYILYIYIQLNLSIQDTHYPYVRGRARTFLGKEMVSF